MRYHHLYPFELVIGPCFHFFVVLVLFCLCCFVFILSATLRYLSLNRSPLVKQSLHGKLSILSFITSTMVMCLCRQKTHCILNQFVPLRYTRLLQVNCQSLDSQPIPAVAAKNDNTNCLAKQFLRYQFWLRPMFLTSRTIFGQTSSSQAIFQFEAQKSE